MTESAQTILIVDDEDIVRHLTLRQLKQLGLTGDECANGQQAVDKVKAQSYDLILMDVQMPVMDGIEAAAAIREIEKSKGTSPTPIVALSASPHEERCRQSGMDDFLLKPIVLADLKRILDKWLKPELSSSR